MDFAKFAATYSVTLAAVGAFFSFLVAPFIGVYWTHWLVAGVIQAFLAATLVSMTVDSIDEDAPGARSAFHGAAVVVLPPLALATLSFLPLVHWPMIAWLIPGGALIVFGLGAVYAAVADDNDEKVRIIRLGNSDDSRCSVPYCSLRSMYQVVYPAETGRKVLFNQCFGHNAEFRVESDNGKLDTLYEVKLWMNREGPWIHWCQSEGMMNEIQNATPAH